MQPQPRRLQPARNALSPTIGVTRKEESMILLLILVLILLVVFGGWGYRRRW